MIKQCCAAFLFAAVSTASFAETAPSTLTEDQKLSYVLGQNTAASLSQQQIVIQADAFVMGLKDALEKNPSKLSKSETEAVITAFTQQRQEKAKAAMDKVAKANIDAGKAFITDYKTKKDVISLPNGIVYKVLKAGSGIQPTIADKVTAHYTGKLVNGQVFDSSIPRGEPSTFALKGVIKGWQEILPMMKVGAKWEVVIPPSLAYNNQRAGQLIGPMSTLVFEIELLEVKKAK